MAAMMFPVMRGAWWDSVLFKVLKDAYDELCKKKKQKKTLFWFILWLWQTKEKEAGWKRLAGVDQLLVEWELPSRELRKWPVSPEVERHELRGTSYKF